MGAPKRFPEIAVLAFPVLFLSPAWGQIPLAGGRMPQATLQGARWGLEADGIHTRTMVFVTNITGGDNNPATLATFDPELKQSAVAKYTMVTGTSVNGVGVTANTNQPGVHRFILDSQKPGDSAKEYLVELFGIPKPLSGFAIWGVVQSFDPAGNIVSAVPLLATTNESVVPVSVSERNFFVPLDIDPMTRTTQSITFVNPDPVVWTSATVSVFDPNPASANRKPFATIQVSIPPGGVSRRISEIFAGAPGWNGGAFMDQSNPQSLLQVTTGFQCMDLSSAMLFANPDGSIVSTELEPLSSEPISSRPVNSDGRTPQNHIMLVRPVRERWFRGECR